MLMQVLNQSIAVSTRIWDCQERRRRPRRRDGAVSLMLPSSMAKAAVQRKDDDPAAGVTFTHGADLVIARREQRRVRELRQQPLAHAGKHGRGRGGSDVPSPGLSRSQKSATSFGSSSAASKLSRVTGLSEEALCTFCTLLLGASSPSGDWRRMASSPPEAGRSAHPRPGRELDGPSGPDAHHLDLEATADRFRVLLQRGQRR